MPYVVRVASGELKELSVFGNDYDTPDGTGVLNNEVYTDFKTAEK